MSGSARGLAIAAGAWLLLILAAPALSTPLAGIVYLIGSLICHQLPDRSFHLRGVQLPVCARCLGLYGGGALGAAIAATKFRRYVPAAWLRSRSAIWTATAIAAMPTVLTFVAERGFGLPVSNAVRALAAVPFALSVAFVVVNGLATLHYD